ncbi:uncharacterized protein BO97DRAFT_388432 [Aspergillus homomorphus CBS 101889]|uniref:Dienelactone hydrolase n=1 Tax=Aspergillus homomorphus (strain CBS 101889) TaxID=1450537 RepID=A0A395I0X7_ASPHC|nr:hypothetical protein BO97DRAFT_388432 [Aspergillus homomorphus CBS 101889]RAL13329.1 hypothetical protein BO97DRAFT_388432 [Aspergillus homomorphus CBS 101889]
MAHPSPTSTPKAQLCVTAEDEQFDEEFLQTWKREGFRVIYIPFHADRKRYVAALDAVKNDLGVSEVYAIISFGDAAAFCLSHYLKLPNTNKLCALIAYYPTEIPGPASRYTASMRVLVHLANQTVNVHYPPTKTGHKGTVVRKQVGPGLGTGDRLALGYPAFSYVGALPGFAEHDLEEYSRIPAQLAWSRTLTALQRGFKKEVDLETVWDNMQEARYFSTNTSSLLPSPSPNTETDTDTPPPPSALYTPTLQGATGHNPLQDFYVTNFHASKPPSMRLQLLSRTQGADSLVDELLMTFVHSQPMQWILPGVPPTHKEVRIVIVSIARLGGGDSRLYSEHVYWDQASVLVQVGLLDPAVVPGEHPGLRRLPVVGGEGAAAVLAEGVGGVDFGGGGLSSGFESGSASASVSHQSGEVGEDGEHGEDGEGELSLEGLKLSSGGQGS